MQPTRDEVDAFLAADKVVPGARQIEWEKGDPTRVFWTHAVQVDGAQLGLVRFHVNAQLPRSWLFKLLLHRAEVYRLDVKPTLANHGNGPKRRRPAGFPRKVTDPEHEHIWHEDHQNMDLALGITELRGSSHEECMREFCKRARIDFEPIYTDPTKGVQLPLGGPESQ
jgi:hypothetical protein